MTESAFIAEHGAVLTVTFDRDAKLNAINPEMTATLWRALDSMAVRDDLRVLVITARGRYFSAGIDLKAPSPATVSKSRGRIFSFRATFRKLNMDGRNRSSANP